MRHHVATRKFGRTRKVRRNFIRSLVRALVLEGRITTTEARAKEIGPVVEKMITIGKRQAPVEALRTLSARLGGQMDTANRLVTELAPRYADRSGGYTRILKMPARQSDGAKMALIELV